MKKILALLLAVLMTAALCACGGTQDNSAAAAPAQEAAPAAPAAAPEAPAQEADAQAEACGEPIGEALNGTVTWADYQAYLIEKTSGNAPDPDAFIEQVNALTGWDDIDQTSPPWDQIFSTLGLSTWEEFQAGIVKDSQVAGGPDASASGEGSGEPTGEPAG